jgi:hypothetical protein
MFAHVAGVPVEEWLVPLLAGGGGFVVALRSAWRRLGSDGGATARARR